MTRSVEVEVVVGDESPELVEALATIAKNDADGLIEPKAVVEAARAAESPLHDQFEWDDGVAAEEYRLVQARSLIARVKVRIIDHGRAPAYVNVRIRTPGGEERRGYLPTTTVAADPDLCAQAMADARRGIDAYRRRLAAFEQARSVLAHLDAALSALSEEGGLGRNGKAWHG